MKFRLTYEGRLEGNGSAKHKHEIRKAFHPQIRRLWEIDPNLSRWDIPWSRSASHPDEKLRKLLKDDAGETYKMWELAALLFQRGNYGYAPLIQERMKLVAGIDILFLRMGQPGGVIRSADLDNRLKTLFDALRMPHDETELGGYNEPSADEKPFFVLLEDDKLINHVSVEADSLLQPTPTADGKYLANDARLIITVHIKLSEVTMNNLHFV